MSHNVRDDRWNGGGFNADVRQIMYRVMVMFDPIQCVATPVDTDTGQPRPSYERPFIPVNDEDIPCIELQGKARDQKQNYRLKETLSLWAFGPLSLPMQKRQFFNILAGNVNDK